MRDVIIIRESGLITICWAHCVLCACHQGRWLALTNNLSCCIYTTPILCFVARRADSNTTVQLYNVKRAIWGLVFSLSVWISVITYAYYLCLFQSYGQIHWLWLIVFFLITVHYTSAKDKSLLKHNDVYCKAFKFSSI